jgi:hypothetical protein
MKLEFLDRFSKNTEISEVMKIRTVGAELFHADRHEAFRNSANAPKKLASYSRLAVCVYGFMLLNQLTDLY